MFIMHKTISMLLGVAALFISAAVCSGNCARIGINDSADKTLVYLLTISDSTTGDPAVIIKEPLPEKSGISPEIRARFSEEEIKELEKKNVPLQLPDLKAKNLSGFVPGYWDGAGLSVAGCDIIETATATFSGYEFTASADSLPVAIVAYKLIRDDAGKKAIWKIFPVYSSGQQIPGTPEELPEAGRPFFGALSVVRPAGAGAIKLKYIDNKRLLTSEKELGIEETWYMPLMHDAIAPGSEAPQPNPKGPAEPGHILKLINHGVYVLDLVAGKKEEK